jgi:hypothetical protein
MPTCDPPATPIPKNISIDLLIHNINLTLANGQECRLKSSSSNIIGKSNDNQNIFISSFDLEGKEIKNISTSLRIEYNSIKHRFWFYKEDGASVRVSLGDENSTIKSLAEFINLNQDIILIGLDDGETVYQGRNFYKIDYSYVEQTLLGLINRPHNAPNCRTEKGCEKEIAAIKRSKDTNFPKDSLFRTVTDNLIELPFVDELLICDDLGSECADFVAANFSEHKLAFIHAKAGHGLKISASAFHDVVSQAMKNLVYFTKGDKYPDKIESWDKNVKWNKTNISRIYRAPDGIPFKKKLWNKIKSDILNSSSPELYVILLTTGCCDLDELREAVINPKKRTPEIAQLLHLLDGLNGYARQLGVRVIIYDLPYQNT